jgi:hypothetical protein
MILALELYHARSGQEDALRRQRLAASDLRVKLGLPRGNVLWLAKGTPELPTVVWTCPFADAKAEEGDRWTRHFSRDYEAARTSMDSACHRSERALYGVADGVHAAMLAPWVWQCWWTVPKQFEAMLLQSLVETASQAADAANRGDAVLRRDEGSNTLPYAICAAAFQERGRAFTALSDVQRGDDDPDAAARPLKPAYSLWERLD